MLFCIALAVRDLHLTADEALWARHRRRRRRAAPARPRAPLAGLGRRGRRPRRAVAPPPRLPPRHAARGPGHRPLTAGRHPHHRSRPPLHGGAARVLPASHRAEVARSQPVTGPSVGTPPARTPERLVGAAVTAVGGDVGAPPAVRTVRGRPAPEPVADPAQVDRRRTETASCSWRVGLLCSVLRAVHPGGRPRRPCATGCRRRKQVTSSAGVVQPRQTSRRCRVQDRSRPGVLARRCAALCRGTEDLATGPCVGPRRSIRGVVRRMKSVSTSPSGEVEPSTSATSGRRVVDEAPVEGEVLDPLGAGLPSGDLGEECGPATPCTCPLDVRGSRRSRRTRRLGRPPGPRQVHLPTACVAVQQRAAASRRAAGTGRALPPPWHGQPSGERPGGTGVHDGVGVARGAADASAGQAEPVSGGRRVRAPRLPVAPRSPQPTSSNSRAR